MNQESTSQTSFHICTRKNNHYLPQISEVTMGKGEQKKMLGHKMLKKKKKNHDDAQSKLQTSSNPVFLHY